MEQNYGVLTCLYYDDKLNDLMGSSNFDDYCHKADNEDFKTELLYFNGTADNTQFSNYYITDEYFHNLKAVDLNFEDDYYFDDLNVLSRLKRLRSLACAKSNLRNLNGIQNFMKLEYLYLDECKITDLSQLEMITELKILNISNNKIEDVSNLKYLTKLEELYCDNNRISNLDSVRDLLNLKIIHCSENQIINLDSLINLTNLKELKCSFNKINNVDFIKNLNKLITLSIADNFIKHLEVGDSVLIEDLDCCNNSLRNTNFIKNLKNLKKFSMYENYGIEELDVEYNTELEYLTCSYNSISEIKNISKCKKLKSLDIRELQLETLSGIEECTNLKHLYIIDVNKPGHISVYLEIPQIIKDYKINNCNITLELNRFLNVINTLQGFIETVYNDEQNVHNSNIVKSIKSSLSYILEEPLYKDINLLHQTL